MRPARLRSTRPRAHQEAVERRLALLAAELAGASGGVARGPDGPRADTPPDPQADLRAELPVELLNQPPVERAAEPRPERARDLDAPPPDAARAPAAGSTAPAAPRLPVPGRHAARRPRPARLGRLRSRAVERLTALPRPPGAAAEPGAWRLGPHHLTVVALVVALGLAGTTWWVVRASPSQVSLPEAAPTASPLLPAAVPTEAPAPPGTTAPAAGATGASLTSSPDGAAGEVVVHVAGDVRRPGLVVLPLGSRVADAVEAAGGARRGTDLGTLNLARPLVDGEQVLVGAAGAAPAPLPVGGGTGAPATSPTPVDLNTADQALLETLPGVGPVTATAILDWRVEHGAFTAVEELLEVDGIGEATLEDLAPLVTV